MSAILWNDILRTYDEQFHLIESARSEYVKFVVMIISGLTPTIRLAQTRSLTLLIMLLKAKPGKNIFGHRQVPWSTNHSRCARCNGAYVDMVT